VKNNNNGQLLMSSLGVAATSAATLLTGPGVLRILARVSQAVRFFQYRSRNEAALRSQVSNGYLHVHLG
jgi:hypothetical protein